MVDINKVKNHNFRKGKILLVEDDPDQSRIIELAIRECIPEVQTVVAASAPQAITYLDDMVTSQQILPKMVLLDLYLPSREDGWLVLQRIKKKSSPLTLLPVIILSNSESREDVRDTYFYGGTAYTVKPLDYPAWLDYFRSIRKHWMETVILPYRSE